MCFEAESLNCWISFHHIVKTFKKFLFYFQREARRRPYWAAAAAAADPATDNLLHTASLVDPRFKTTDTTAERGEGNQVWSRIGEGAGGAAVWPGGPSRVRCCSIRATEQENPLEVSSKRRQHPLPQPQPRSQSWWKQSCLPACGLLVPDSDSDPLQQGEAPRGTVPKPEELGIKVICVCCSLSEDGVDRRPDFCLCGLNKMLFSKFIK